MLGKQGIKPEELPRCVIASRKAMKSKTIAAIKLNLRANLLRLFQYLSAIILNIIRANA
jgi:hypothetical protein